MRISWLRTSCCTGIPRQGIRHPGLLGSQEEQHPLLLPGVAGPASRIIMRHVVDDRPPTIQPTEVRHG